MIISSFFYARCDPTYQKEVLDPLEKEITEIQEMPGDEFTVEKSNLIKAAICKYADWNVIPHEYWHTLTTYLSETNDDEWRDMEHKALDHYVHEENPFTNEDEYDPASYYLLEVERYYSKQCPKEPVHDFPNDWLYLMFYDYQKNVMTLHPTKDILDKYERMEKLYYKIKAAENITKKWFNLLLGVNIDQFLRTNVEYRLGLNLLDRQLWKLYIDYLKTIDPKAMLIVYSRYVRFFMDDKEILGEYERAAKQHGPVKLFWQKLLEFEKQPQMLESIDVDMKNADEEEKMDVTEAKPPFNPQICAAFFNNVNRQNDLSFLKPTIDYILDNASPAILQKLFKSGKYFFARKPTPICYRLVEHADVTAFNEESVALNYLDDIVLDNVLISNTMKIRWLSAEIVPDTFKKYTSTLIPHFFRCDAKFINLDNQNLSFKELKFLIKGGNCVELKLRYCEIKDENDEYVEWEKIMELLPKITNLILPTVKVNSNTAHALSAQKFEDKIAFIKIQNIVGKPFDAEKFKNFIVAKRCEFFKIDLVFDPLFNATFVATLKKIMEEYRKTCDLSNVTIKIN